MQAPFATRADSRLHATLDDILSALRAKRVRLTPSLAGYFILEIAASAELVDRLSNGSVFLLDDGTVSVASRAPLTPLTATPLRQILGELLEAASLGATPMATIARAPGDELRTLLDDIASALMPMNRAAGRRALGRLVRFTRNQAPPSPESSAQLRDLVDAFDAKPRHNENPIPESIEIDVSELEAGADIPLFIPAKKKRTMFRQVVRVALVLTASIAIGTYLGLSWSARHPHRGLFFKPVANGNFETKHR